MVGRSFTMKKSSGDDDYPYYSIRKGWVAVACVFVAGFSVMGFTGKIIYDNAPPIPTFRLEGHPGPVLWTSEDVLEGQQILGGTKWTPERVYGPYYLSRNYSSK